MIIIKNVSFLVVFIGQIIFSQSGFISGSVTDAQSSEGLIGANIIVNELDNMGAAADLKGYFRIKVPVGSYSIRVSLVGYNTVIKTDVIVRSGADAVVNVKLSPTALELDQITVVADYFDKSIIENDLSTVVLGAEEVRRSPGSSQDFQRILQAMAGVSFSTDQTNELLVRGGAPNENLVIFDNMEIHSTNHYPNEMNSGGPINMINVDLIDDIQFSTGGFIAKYGDKLSSVLVVNSREGTRNSPLKINTNLSMAGFGAIAEGKIDGGKGSWIFSGRKSYINLIAGSFGLTSIPYYYDAQFKIAYDLSKEHKLSWSGIYGNDKIHIEGVPDRTDINYANSADTIDVENINVKQNQYAVGFTLRSIWTNNFFSVATVSTNNYHDNIDFSFDYTERRYDNTGKMTNTNILSRRSYFNNLSDNGTTDLKLDFVWNLNRNNELNFGGAYRTGRYKQSTSISADTVRYDVNGDGVFDGNDIIIARPDAYFTNDYKLFDQFKSYFYLNDKLKLFNNRLLINLGLRYDYFTYSKQGSISPRISASYYFIPDITNINFAYGRYYQSQSYPTYGDRYNSKINQYLENSLATHFVIGFEYIIDEGLKLTFESYFKDYTKLPVSEDFINFNNRLLRSEKNFTIGKQQTYGIDILLQQKLVKDIYGTFAFSRMWNRYEDPRIGYEGKTYPSDYDFPYVVTIIVGKRYRDLRSELDMMPFYIKYATYLLPFSDDMEISLRWRYASGKPYTPREFVTYEQYREGATKWSRGRWIATENINGSRYPDYHRLDLGFNSRYNFNNWSLSVFLSIQNIYNRKNIAFYQYNSDGTIENVYQFAILPVAGIEIQF